MLAISMDDDCIRRCWLENVPVVEKGRLKSRYIAALPQREWATPKGPRTEDQPTPVANAKKDLSRLPEGCSMQRIVLGLGNIVMTNFYRLLAKASDLRPALKRIPIF